jgi:hypothetical protein
MSDKAMYGYVAGIVDGEGTITIGRSEYMNTKTGKYRHGQKYHQVGFHAVISVKNTDERLMKWLQSRFGGQYYTEKRIEAAWKDAYKWHHCAENKEQFLLAILPYLVLKREQAKILLEFLRIEKWLKVPTKRQELYEKIVALNQRGKPVETNTQDSSDEEKIESVLIGDSESTPTVTLAV